MNEYCVRNVRYTHISRPSQRGQRASAVADMAHVCSTNAFSSLRHRVLSSATRHHCSCPSKCAERGSCHLVHGRPCRRWPSGVHQSIAFDHLWSRRPINLPAHLHFRRRCSCGHSDILSLSRTSTTSFVVRCFHCAQLSNSYSTSPSLLIDAESGAELVELSARSTILLPRPRIARSILRCTVHSLCSRSVVMAHEQLP